MDTDISTDDEGKDVVDADGETIGIISGVRGGTAYVDPSPGLGDQLMAKMGWENVDEDDYPLDTSKIDRVSDDEVMLRRDL